MQKRIEEFTEYGEIDMMKQYVDDAKNVQKRITDAEIVIDWIRNVNHLFFIHLFIYNKSTTKTAI
jgi:hypothetical protein